MSSALIYLLDYLGEMIQDSAMPGSMTRPSLVARSQILGLQLRFEAKCDHLRRLVDSAIEAKYKGLLFLLSSELRDGCDLELELTGDTRIFGALCDSLGCENPYQDTVRNPAAKARHECHGSISSEPLETTSSDPLDHDRDAMVSGTSGSDEPDNS